MRYYNTNYGTAGIQCLEIAIPEHLISARGLYRTLTLYSLQFEPLADNPAGEYQEVFQFMLFDWSRTLKPLLEERSIPYKISRHFSLPVLYDNGERVSSDADHHAINAVMMCETQM